MSNRNLSDPAHRFRRDNRMPRLVKDSKKLGMYLQRALGKSRFPRSIPVPLQAVALYATAQV